MADTKGPGFYVNDGGSGSVIQNFIITGGTDGFILDGANSCTIANNDITGTSDRGIFLLNYSNNNTITGNIIENTNFAVDLFGPYGGPYNNTLQNNTIQNNIGAGIRVMGDNNNVLLNYIQNGGGIGIESNGNQIVGNILSDDGISTTGSNNYVYNNTITDSMIVVSGDSNNISENTISNGGSYGIELSHASNALIVKNNILNAHLTGIWIEYSMGNQINDNQILNNGHGIIFAGSSNNTIYNNNVRNSILGYGLAFYYDSTNNTFYNNYFINNMENIHLNGCIGNIFNLDAPIGGNYWSDYTGVDDNLDGIGDTPYTITDDTTNTTEIIDSLPLMGMGTVFIVDPQTNGNNTPLTNDTNNSTENNPPLSIITTGSSAKSITIKKISIAKVAATSSSDHQIIVTTGSIQDAINSASDGDTILLRSGNNLNRIYNENIIINKKIIIKPYGNDQITIMALDNNKSLINITPNGINSVIQGLTITGGSSGLDLNANNCIISKNIINGTQNGIFINSSYDLISGNLLINNINGIISENSSNNIIYNNNFLNNTGSGITFNNSTNNKIYKNEFINNHIQSQLRADSTGNIFYLTLPIGGNYWSDYTGTDSNNDGIGDTPYINMGLVDNYPIMKPLSPIITISDPINNATVTVNKIINITFNEPIQAGINFDYITVTNNIGTQESITKTINGNVLTLTRSNGEYLNNMTYTIFLPINSISDLSDIGLSNIFESTFNADGILPTANINTTSGLYNTTLTISLTMSEPGTIYYTLNGTNPTTSDFKYSTQININTTTTLKYLAIDLAGNKSSIYINIYTIDTKPPTASANPIGGLYNATKSVILTISEPGTIYFTTDGTDPTTYSSKYLTNLPITDTTTLKYLAIDLAGNKSPTYTQIYTIDKIAPTAKINLVGGLYNINKVVALTMSEAGTIYYTLNGTTPTTSSSKYTGPITISSSKTLKYLEIDTAGNKSPIYTQTYIIDKVAPKVASTSPSNNAIISSLTSSITIKFTENILTGINYSKIYVKNLNTGKITTITKTISGNTLIIKQTNNRIHKDTYQILHTISIH